MRYTLEPVPAVEDKFRLIDEAGGIKGYVWPSIREHGRWRFSWTPEIDAKLDSRESATTALVGIISALNGTPVEAGEAPKVFQPFKMLVDETVIKDLDPFAPEDVKEVFARHRWEIRIHTPAEAEAVLKCLKNAHVAETRNRRRTTLQRYSAKIRDHLV